MDEEQKKDNTEETVEADAMSNSEVLDVVDTDKLPPLDDVTDAPANDAEEVQQITERQVQDYAETKDSDGHQP